MQIVSIDEQDELFTYTGKDKNGRTLTFSEQQLAHHIQLNRPTARLFNQQFDADKWFRIR